MCSAGKPSSDPSHPDYIPTLFPHRTHGNLRQKLDRFQRTNKRCAAQVDAVASAGSQTSDNAGSDSSNGAVDVEVACNASTETILSIQDISVQILENKKYKKHVRCLELELEAAKNQIATLEKVKVPLDHAKVTEGIVTKTNKTVKFHTGLVSIAMFNSLLQMLSIRHPPSMTRLSHTQQFILVLMRLRLGLLTQDLAGRFGISSATVSSRFPFLA